MNREQLKKLEDDLWSTADSLRANSDLKSSEYSTCVLGLIFLKFADNNYRKYEDEILAEYEELKGTRREREISEIAVEKCGFFLPEHSRYEYLLNLPEQEDIVNAIKDAMSSIEEFKPELAGVLPQDEYFRFNRTEQNRAIPKRLLKKFADIPANAGGDLFGQIYEYFLGKFALAEGQGGGEFFTPRSVVQLMVEVIEPHRGKVFDPACGSGGMFVQSGKFIEEHSKQVKDGDGSDLFVYGQEKTLETVKLAKMNLAVNGLRGDIRQSNTYYEDPFNSFEQYDYVLANPPFNVDDVSLESVEKDARFNTYGVPRRKTKSKKKGKGQETVPNANYLWINLFATSLNASGRAALVMANSAADAKHSEADIRKTLIEKNLIYGMLTLPSNMFYTVALPATLWFFDKAKEDDKILFIDARNIFTQIDKSHREFSSAQVQNIATISHLRKGNGKFLVDAVDGYFEKGMTKLYETKPTVEPISQDLKRVLTSKEAGDAIESFLDTWSDVGSLKKSYDEYVKLTSGENNIQKKIPAQIDLREPFDNFFAKLHENLKRLDRVFREYRKDNLQSARSNGKSTQVRELKKFKQQISELHGEVKRAEEYYSHIAWLQDRFPTAEYQDVTGLCKLASLDEVREQEYSLNPGRYVGVMIEEDGKTEEEFIDELITLKDELATLEQGAHSLEEKIHLNINALVG